MGRADPMARLRLVDRQAALSVRLWLRLVAVAWVLLLAVMLWPQPAAAALELPPAAAQAWRGELTRAAHSQWGLDAPLAALAAQVHQESGWNPAALSQVGAQGMAQFMPATARWWCGVQRQSAAECQPSNPRWALRAMVGYDRWLWERVPQAAQPPDGDAARLWATLRAYNGGLGHWQAEARLAGSPARRAVDAACGSARRARRWCPENLGYPRRILQTLQPRYATWGPVLTIAQE